MHVSKAGVVEKSCIHDSNDASGARTVFNLIVTLLEGALEKLLPTKLSAQEKEVEIGEEESWTKVPLPNPNSPDTVPADGKEITQLEPITFPTTAIPNYREEAWSKIHPPNSFSELETVPSDKEEILDLPPHHFGRAKYTCHDYRSDFPVLPKYLGYDVDCGE